MPTLSLLVSCAGSPGPGLPAMNSAAGTAAAATTAVGTAAVDTAAVDTAAVDTAAVDTAAVDTAAILSAGIDNIVAHRGNQFSSGQPTAGQLAMLSDAGIRHVISLRLPGEVDWDESAVVAGIGMTFHSLVIDDETGVTVENARLLDALLERLAGRPLLLHCSSSNRVGALMALREASLYGVDVDAAIAVGRRWGLTRLEPVVAERVKALMDSRGD